MHTRYTALSEPQSIVRYEMTARNTTAFTQTLTLTITDSDWDIQPSIETTILLEPEAGDRIAITVHIPADAPLLQPKDFTAMLTADDTGETLGSVRFTVIPALRTFFPLLRR